MSAEELQSQLSEWRRKLTNAKQAVQAAGTAVSESQLQVYHLNLCVYRELAKRIKICLQSRAEQSPEDENLKKSVEKADVVLLSATQELEAQELAKQAGLNTFRPMEVDPKTILGEAEPVSEATSAGGATAGGVKLEVNTGSEYIASLVKAEEDRKTEMALDEIKVLTSLTQKPSMMPVYTGTQVDETAQRPRGIGSLKDFGVKPMKQFTGDPSHLTIRDYCDMVEAISASKKLSSTEMVNLVEFTIANEALQWFTLSKRKKKTFLTSYSLLKIALFERFDYGLSYSEQVQLTDSLRLKNPLLSMEFLDSCENVAWMLVEAGSDEEKITIRELKERIATLLFTQKSPPDLREAIADDDARTLSELRRTVKKFVAKLRARENKPTFNSLNGMNVSAVEFQENETVAQTSAVAREMRPQAQTWGAPPGQPFKGQRPWQGGGAQAKPGGAGQVSGKSTAELDKQLNRCFYCHKPNHQKRNCYLFKRAQGAQQSQKAKAAATTGDDSESTQPQQIAAINYYDILDESSE